MLYRVVLHSIVVGSFEQSEYIVMLHSMLVGTFVHLCCIALQFMVVGSFEQSVRFSGRRCRPWKRFALVFRIFLHAQFQAAHSFSRSSLVIIYTHVYIYSYIFVYI